MRILLINSQRAGRRGFAQTSTSTLGNAISQHGYTSQLGTRTANRAPSLTNPLSPCLGHWKDWLIVWTLRHRTLSLACRPQSTFPSVNPCNSDTASTSNRERNSSKPLEISVPPKEKFLLLCFLWLTIFFLAASASTSSFSIQEHNGEPWLFKPNGEPFFSLGVCFV